MHATNSDTLLETLVARTIGDASGLSMSALLAAPVPAGILRYLRAEIINKLSDDLAHAPHFARVTPPAAGPDTLREALLAHAAGQYIFPRAEFLEVLDNAAHFTENYLCRPRWTLASFLFVDQPAISTETLLRKLEYITEYAYLPQLMRRMAVQSGKQVIASSECTAMIARIDDAVVREHSPHELALLTKPLFEFFLLSGDVEGKPIDLRAILMFLQDKQLTKLRDYVEGVWHVRGKSGITLQEFAELSEDFAFGKPVTAAEPVEESPPANHLPETPVTEPSVPEPAPEAPAEEPAPQAPPQPLPIESQPQDEPIQESLPFAVEAPPPPVDAVTDQREVSSEEQPQEEPRAPEELASPPVSQEIQPAEIAPEDATPPPPEPDIPTSPTLTEMIPADLRRRFISVICGRDAEFYDLVMARLDEMHSWAEASAYIRELFEINNIDPFNETAVAFTDVVQRRYDRPGGA